MAASWTDVLVSTPLLRSSSAPRPLPDEASIQIDAPVSRGPPQPPFSPPQEGLQVVRRFRRLLAELRPYQALSLAVLSIFESILVAEVGKVAGSIYQLLIDKQPGAFAAALLHAIALYAGCAAASALGVYISGLLSLRWRRMLASRLHVSYCTGLAFAKLPGELDNPDQRISLEVATLCDALASAARLATGAPFRVVFYSCLAWKYLGWRGTAAAFGFFWAGAAVQRLVAAPLARLTVAQERREGDLRFVHVRLRDRAADVAASRGAKAELESMTGALGSALTNQRQLVWWRAGMAGVTRAIDYSGAALNYALVAAAVFAGGAGQATGGEVAKFVSNASFSTLSLIYSFTEILDLAEQASILAALAARVVGLLEALPPTPTAAAEKISSYERQLQAGRARTSGEGGSQGHGLGDTAQELRPTDFADVLQPPVLLSFLGRGGSVPLELSVHSLGAALRREVREIFPEAPRDPQRPMQCVLTFQFAGGGSIDLSPDRSSATVAVAAAEMDRLLDAFLRWEKAVREALVAKGTFWSDSVDPRTGMALHGARGARWSEVAAARALLQYDRRDAGVCPLVAHPTHGTSAYPVSFFTDAPSEIVFEVLTSLSQTPLPTPRPLATLQGLSVSTPDGKQPLVTNLSLAIAPGSWVLVTGPNGAGKSTLMRVLCGLYSPTAGTLTFGSDLLVNSAPLAQRSGASSADGSSNSPFEVPELAMFLPQRPLAAPGPKLWQQIAYPGTERPNDVMLRALLTDVGLGRLFDRMGGDLGIESADWAGQLSPGEMQRIAIARVLLRRPRLALLDEATSAVAEGDAAELMGRLRDAGVTCVVVTQDAAAFRGLAAVQLKLAGENGAWMCEKTGAGH